MERCDCAAWALGQFDGADLGDARLSKDLCVWPEAVTSTFTYVTPPFNWIVRRTIRAITRRVRCR